MSWVCPNCLLLNSGLVQQCHRCRCHAGLAGHVAMEPPTDPRRAQSDDVAREVASWPRSKQLQVYEHLYNGYGCRISNIDYEIDKAWREEQKAKS